MAARLSDLHIGMMGPITLSEFREHLDDQGELPVGQGGTPVNILCRHLLERGHRLTIFTMDPGIEHEVVVSGARLRICVVPFGRPPGRRPARDFFRAERRMLAAAVRRERPDVLHAQWTDVHAWTALESGLPHLVTAHDAHWNGLWKELIPFRVAIHLMALGALSRARWVASVSPYVASHIRRYMLYRGEDLVIPNGIPETVFQIERPARRGPGPTFGTVLNGWNRLKNGEGAVRAFGLARRRLGGARLVMFGAGHGPDGAAARWATAQGLADGVEFVGPTPHDELLRWLASEVDVLVHPSREESFSMAIAEACALGVPVVAGSSSGAVPWTLANGAAGILTDVRSPRALAASMVEVATNRQLSDRLSRAGRQSTQERFGIAGVADAYLALYEKVIRSFPHGRRGP
jgi:glycosyltransferase involved in cell wall biosynthesis